LLNQYHFYVLKFANSFYKYSVTRIKIVDDVVGYHTVICSV